MANRRLIFFSSVFIALIVGLSVRIYFSSARMESWVRQSLERSASDVQFSAKKMELSLARGAIPHLAIKILDLKISQNDKCMRNSEWLIDEVYFPLRLTSLWQQQVQFGNILAKTINLNVGTVVSNCFKAPAKSDNSERPEKTETTRQPQQEKAKSTVTMLDFASGVKIQRLNLHLADLPNYVFSLTQFQLTVEKDMPLLLYGNLAMQNETNREESWPMTRFSGDVSPDKINLNLNGHWQEGVINVGVMYDASSEKQLNVEGHIKHLPLANFLKLYEQVNSHPIGSYPRSMWLSCNIDLSSSVQNLASAPLRLKSCLIEGDGGTWESEKLVFDPSQGAFIEPFSIKVARLPLKTLMSLFQIDVLGGVLDQYGFLSGQLQVNPPANFTFEGMLEEMMVYFSSRNLRGQQAVPKINLQIEKSQGRLSGLFSKFELRRGGLDGSISFNFDKRFQDGYVQIQAKNIVFDPSIQELLVKEKLGPMEAYGKFKITNGKLEVFKGDLGIDFVENDSFQLDKIKFSASYFGPSLKGSLRVKALQIAPASEFFEFLRPLLLDKRFNDPWVGFQDLAMQVEGYNQQISWDKAKVYLPAEKVNFSSQGNWQYNSGLSGWVSVDFPNLKLLKWELSGDFASPKLLPSTMWLKELVSEKGAKEKPAKTDKSPKKSKIKKSGAS